jgi:hypothetical protein
MLFTTAAQGNFISRTKIGCGAAQCGACTIFTDHHHHARPIGRPPLHSRDTVQVTDLCGDGIQLGSG